MSKIKEFQEKYGLVADGILGKKTFSKMKEVWKISDEQLANFLGQTSIESANFTKSKENLNYSKERLLEVFPKYFNSTTASLYAKQPQKIANRVYANRMGNKDEASGDGFMHIGASSLQVTGKDNYIDFSNWVGAKKKLTTDEIADNYFWEGGLYYFEKNKLWSLASKVDDISITQLSKAINLGSKNSKYTPNHLKERIDTTKKYYNLIKK